MPRNDEEVRETFAWGVLWSIFLLTAIIVAAGYFLWYKPTYVPRKANQSRAAVFCPSGGADKRPRSIGEV